ncbi:MAG: hypothetical protein F4Z40_00300 [Chloroflexi bacterium]|nr:hypothetical protein [Chloroflexota bacterium]
MALFVVYTKGEKAGQALSRLINDETNDITGYPLGEQSHVVASDSEDPKVLGLLLEIGAPGNEGVVFRLNGAYYGFFDSDLWEYMKRARGQHV